MASKSPIEIATQPTTEATTQATTQAPNQAATHDLAMLCGDADTIARTQRAVSGSRKLIVFQELGQLRQFLHERRADQLTALVDLDAIPDGTRNWTKSLPGDTRALVISSAREIHRVRLFLELGGKDFILKPFQAEELVARVELMEEPILQKKAAPRELLSVFEPRLTQTEHRILRVFLSSETWSVTRDELMTQIWLNAYIQPNALDVHLFNLRKKIRGSGYRIVAQGKMRCWKFEKDEVEIEMLESKVELKDCR